MPQYLKTLHSTALAKDDGGALRTGYAVNGKQVRRLMRRIGCEPSVLNGRAGTRGVYRIYPLHTARDGHRTRIRSGARCT